MKVLNQIGKSILYAIVIIIVILLLSMFRLFMINVLKLAPDIIAMITTPILFVVLCISYYVTHLGK